MLVNLRLIRMTKNNYLPLINIMPLSDETTGKVKEHESCPSG